MADPRNARRLILDALLANGPMSRADLSRATHLSRSTVSGLVSELLAERLVEEPENGVARGAARMAGRPATLVSLADRKGYLVGIDFGRLHLRVGVCDRSYRLLAEAESDFDVDRSAEQALEAAAVAVEALLEEACIQRGDVLGVGIGVPGPVDKHTGMLHAGSILASWVGADVPGQISRRLGLPVSMDNDANLGALAESTFGAGTNVEVLLYVLLSVGVGLGIVIDGKLFRGAGGIAGELGHVVTDDMGLLCRCGNRGCLEAQVSVNTLRDAMRSGHGPVSVREFLQLAKAGNVGANRVIADAATLVGRLVGDLCNYFNPDLILVGGELSAVGDTALDPLRASMRRFAIARACENVRVGLGALGERAELYGAMLLAGRNIDLAVPPEPLATDAALNLTGK